MTDNKSLAPICDNNCKVLVPSVLWRCWLDGRKAILPVKN